MKVRTLKAHGNCHGEQYAKAVGDTYEHPAPEAELSLGNVENADDSEADGDEGNRAGAGRSEVSNSKKQNAQGSKAIGRAGSKKG